MPASPTCTVNGGSTANGVDVAASSTVTIALANHASVSTWVPSIVGADDVTGASYPTLTVDPVAMTATFPASASLGSTYRVQSQVNGGLSQGQPDASLTTTFTVHVLVGGLRTVAADEGLESNSANGWSAKQNAAIRSIGRTVVDVTNFGASATASASANHTAIIAAHAALPAAGGTLIFPDGVYTTTGLVFTKPIRLQFGSGGLTCSGNTDLITTNNNLVATGLSRNETTFTPTAGYDAIRLTGTVWTQGQVGQPAFLCQRIGFSGGRRGITSDVPPPSGFEEGLWCVRDCVFKNTTGYALYLGPSTYYSYVEHNYFYNCFGSAHTKDNCETKFAHNVHFIASNGEFSYRFEGVHHNNVSHDEICGGLMNTSADIAYITRNADNDTHAPIPSTGISSLHAIKFAPEFDLTMRYRPKIICLSADGATKPVTGVTAVGLPLVLTVVGHGYLPTPLHHVEVVGVGGQADGNWAYTVVDANHIALVGRVGDGTEAATGTTTDNPINDFAALRVQVTGCEFSAMNAGVPVLTVARDGATGVATIVFDLSQVVNPQTGVAMTDHGLVTGQIMHLVGFDVATLLAGDHVVTRVNATTVTFQHITGAALVAGLHGGASAWSGSASAITLINPAAQWLIDDNTFDGFAHWVDDGGSYNSGPYGLGGQSVLGPGNRGRGPSGTGRGYTPFARGGAGFQRAAMPANTCQIPVDPDATPNLDTAILRNDILNSSDLTTWTSSGVTATGGQAGRFGGLKAHKLTRTGTALGVSPGGFNSSTHKYPWSVGQSLSTKLSIAAHYGGIGAALKGQIRFDAKGDSTAGTRTGEIFVYILDGTSGRIIDGAPFQIPVGAWSEDEIVFNYTIPSDVDTANLSLCLCPGTWDPRAAICWVENIRHCDARGSSYVATTGTAIYDESIGLRSDRRGIVLSDLRSTKHLGVAPTLGAPNGLGASGAARLVAGSNDREGIIELDCAGAGNTAGGYVVLNFSRTLVGQPVPSDPALVDSTLVWPVATTTGIGALSTSGVQLKWNTNGAALPTGATGAPGTYRLAYKIGLMSLTGAY